MQNHMQLTLPGACESLTEIVWTGRVYLKKQERQLMVYKKNKTY